MHLPPAGEGGQARGGAGVQARRSSGPAARTALCVPSARRPAHRPVVSAGEQARRRRDGGPRRKAPHPRCTASLGLRPVLRTVPSPSANQACPAPSKRASATIGVEGEGGHLRSLASAPRAGAGVALYIPALFRQKGWGRVRALDGSERESPGMAAQLSGPSSGSKFNIATNADMNVTPMVDVMLVLLIIFMVAAPVPTLSIKLDLPPALPNTAPPPKPPTVVSIQKSGAIFVGPQGIGHPEPAVRLGGRAGRQTPRTRPSTSAPTRK